MNTTENKPKTLAETGEQPVAAPSAQSKQGGPHFNRVAMRKATRLGLQPKDGAEAAQMLTERGIDVLNDQITMVHIAAEADKGGGVVVTDDKKPAKAANVPAPQVTTEAERLIEIAKIKRGMIRRRRLRLLLLSLRLVIFVALPTFLAGYYFYNVATPMYVVESQMSVQRADPTTVSAAGALGMSLPNTEDSTVVQGFLTSREAMLRLNDEHGFVSHLQQDFIDDIQRLPSDATMEDAYTKYLKFIRIGYDPTVGTIKMTVLAIDPETALTYSRALIGYAEERVDQMSQRVRDDQMRGASASYQLAEDALLAAQQNVLELQEKSGVLSADAEITAQMSLINALNLQVEQRRLALAEINANSQPNSARANALSSEITRLEARVAELRTEMTGNVDQDASLARVRGELRIAETELQTRSQLLQASLEQLESARIQADRQVRYLNLAVTPVAPDVATYPRKLENTLLALVVFFGIYIFLSLTVSILREQVNA